MLQHLDVDAKIEVDAVKVVSNLTALATLLVEKGVVTREELVGRAGDSFPLSQPAPVLHIPTSARSQPRPS